MSNHTNNDDKIKQYRKTVEAFRKKIGDSPKLQYATNGVLILDGGKFNLNLLNSIDACIDVASQLINRDQSYLKACSALGLPEKNLMLGNYPVTDWIGDIRQRVDMITWRTEKTKLDTMDAKLKELMSEEAKTADVLSDIANELGIDFDE